MRKDLIGGLTGSIVEAFVWVVLLSELILIAWVTNPFSTETEHQKIVHGHHSHHHGRRYIK